MTLQDLLDQTQGTDITQIPVYANNDCVYDFKESTNSLKLIHNDNCYNLEQVTLAELIKYAEECNLETYSTYILSEDSNEFYTSSDFIDYKLNLKY